MNWEKYRDNNGNIDLKTAFRDYLDEYETLDPTERATDYIDRIEKMGTIRSRQAAAIILSTAVDIARDEG